MLEHYPILNTHRLINALSSNLQSGLITQDTAGEIVAVWGTPTSQSWTSGSKEIVGVDVAYSTINTVTSSLWQVSLQALSASGNPIKPTGIPLALWTGSTSTLTNVGVTRHLFTSSYSISPDTKLATVFQFLIFSASTTVLVGGYPGRSSEYGTDFGVSTSNDTGSTWTITGNVPTLRFVCADSSSLYLKGSGYGLPSGRNISNDFTSASTGTGIDDGDERGMLWVPNKTYDIRGFTLLGRRTNANSAVDVCMYRDTTLLASQSLTFIDNPRVTDVSRFVVSIASPVRVNPNDNIRFTVKPTNQTTRHYRFSFASTEDMKEFFGGDGNETNLSYTNRVDGGAWNTPTSASYSLLPVQIYGTEVTGSGLLSGSARISGSVVLNGQLVSNATVLGLRTTDGSIITTQSSETGTYSLNLTSSNYHVFVEYQSGSQLYNANSSWNIQPV